MQDKVKNLLLAPGDLTNKDLFKTLDQALSKGADYADLYLQYLVEEYWSLENGIVKKGDFSISSGGAIHATKQEQSGFAYTEQLTLPSILDIASTAGAIIKQEPHTATQNIQLVKPDNIYPTDIGAITDIKKIDLLNRINNLAYTTDSRVKQVRASLSIDYEAIYFLNSNGDLAIESRPLVRLDVFVVMIEGKLKEEGHAGQGGRFELDKFIESAPEKQLVIEAINLARHGLQAESAPSGVMPVVLGPGWPAVLLHEAVGHGLEADFNRKKSSAFTHMMGKQIANSKCTVIDDATINNCRGSIAIDDEGVKGQATVLIEDGVLVNYMSDRLSSRIMGIPATGNGRRESYASPPLPRMTNTFLQAGTDDPEEIINSVDKGIYCTNFSGGQVDITSGKFVFSANQAYLIENGKLTAPIKNLTLVGDGPEVLTKVSMVGYDLALDNGIGVCGKAGQSVPVGVGQPTLKVDELVVGGC